MIMDRYHPDGHENDYRRGPFHRARPLRQDNGIAGFDPLGRREQAVTGFLRPESLRWMPLALRVVAAAVICALVISSRTRAGPVANRVMWVGEGGP